MRGVLYAFILTGLLIGGLIAWLELGDDGAPQASLPGAGEAETATAEAGEAGEAGAESDGDDAGRAHPLLAALPRPEAGPLPAGPMPALLEAGVDGRMPRAGDDGTMPWRAYAKPFDNPEGKPVVAVLVTGLGLKRDITALAVEGLPGAVSLAFSPYGEALEEWAARARAAGHETLVAIPQEPAAYPANDPGDKALLSDMPAAELSQRLRWSLSRFPGYVGAAGFMGERFVASAAGLRPMMQELRARGLLYADTAQTPESMADTVARELDLPFVRAALRIDATLSPGAIDARLAEAAEIARREGSAAVLAEPYPLSIERIALWAGGLEDVALAPLSAVARPQATQ